MHKLSLIEKKRSESEDQFNNNFAEGLERLNTLDRFESEPLIKRTKGSVTLQVSQNALKTFDEFQSISEPNFLADILSSHLHFVIEFKNIFYGTQKWVLDLNENVEEAASQNLHHSEPYIVINKIDIAQLSIFNRVEADFYPLLLSSDCGRFLEFYAWDK